MTADNTDPDLIPIEMFMCFHRQTNSNHEQILHNLTVGEDRHLSGKGLSKDHKIVLCSLKPNPVIRGQHWKSWTWEAEMHLCNGQSSQK